MSSLKPFLRETLTVDSVCNSITDCLHSSPVYQDEGFLVIRNQNIKSGRLLLNDPSYTDVSTFRKRRKRAVPKAGDLIITREAPMGEVCRLPKGIECCLGQRMVLLKPNNKNIDGSYLLYALMSEYVQKQIQVSNGTGSTVSNLRLPLLRKLKIPDFGTDSNRAIASVLSTLDAKIDLNNRINAELEKLARTIYDYWFLQFDFPDEQGRPYRSSGGKMRYDEQLGREVPEGWEVKPLKRLGRIQGGSTPSRKIAKNFTDNGTAWITPKDLSSNKTNIFMTRGETDVTESGIADAGLKLLPKGSVLMTSRAPVGYLAIASNEVTTNQGFKSFIPNDRYSPEFTYLFLDRHMPLIQANASGSTFQEISGLVLGNIAVLLPADFLVYKFSNIANPIFEKIAALEQQNHQLAALRDWLLPLLMSGQVTVGEPTGE